MEENLKAKARRYNEIYKGAKDGDIVEVGELRLKRTVIENPARLELYMSHDTLLALTVNAMTCQLTPDEYVRQLITDDIKKH